MVDMFCPECNKMTEVVFDHSTGDTVCFECDIVFEAHSNDETSDWRTCENNSDENDPSRVGSPSNSSGIGGGLSTVTSKSKDGASGDCLSSSPSRLQNRGCNPRETITIMCEILCLPATIKDRASEIYKKCKKSIRGRKLDAILAACLSVAYRQEDRPCTVRATLREINRAKEAIVKQLEVGIGESIGTVRAEEFLKRFCSYLGMTNAAAKAAQEAVLGVEEVDIRRSPISVAATVIYMIPQLSNDKISLRDISVATGVKVLTIHRAYKDLYPHTSRLIPDSFYSTEDLQNLLRP